MAAFSTLALIGAGLLGAGAVAKKLTSNKSSGTLLAPGPASTSLGRSRPADSPIIGQAIPRVDPNAPAKVTAPTPPTPANAGSTALGAADAAAQKARRRGSNASLLTGSGPSPKSPKFAPKTLLGY